jgi:hypothetical protein
MECRLQASHTFEKKGGKCHGLVWRDQTSSRAESVQCVDVI